MVWLAYIGPGSDMSPAGPGGLVVALLVSFVLAPFLFGIVWSKRRGESWQLGAVGRGLLGVLALSELLFADGEALVALLLVAGALMLLVGRLLAALGSGIYALESPACLRAAPQRPWPPGAR